MSKAIFWDGTVVMPGSRLENWADNVYRQVDEARESCSRIAVVKGKFDADYARSVVCGNAPWDNYGRSAPFSVSRIEDISAFSKPVALETPEKLYVGVAEAVFIHSAGDRCIDDPELTIEFYLEKGDDVAPIERALGQKAELRNYVHCCLN